MCRFARGYADHTEHDHQALLAAVAQGVLHTEAANDRLIYHPNHSPDYEIARILLPGPLPASTATAQLSLTSTIDPSRQHFVPQTVPRRSRSAPHLRRANRIRATNRHDSSTTESHQV